MFIIKKWKLLTGNKEEIYNLGRKFLLCRRRWEKTKDLPFCFWKFCLIDKIGLLEEFISLDPTSMASFVRRY
jgi:protein SCO1/2